MKNIIQYLFLTFSLLFLFSCNKGKNYVEMIPQSADFVIQINTKSIAQKGKLDQIEQYKLGQFSLNELNTIDPALKDLIEELRKSPTQSGLDLISPMYIFGQKFNNQLVVTLALNMNDKSDFESQLKTIFKATQQRDIEFETKNDYTFITTQKSPLMVWNKKHFLLIAGEMGNPSANLEEYFNQLITNDKLLINQNSFGHFVKNTQDINFWCTGNFLKYFSNHSNPSQNKLDFSKSSWSTFISFADDQINLTQKFHPDTATKVELEKRPMWKNKINTEMYKYFPAKSYFNASFAAHPANTRYLFDNKNLMIDFLEELNINETTFEESFNGEVLFSVFDFEHSKSFNIYDYFEKTSPFEKHNIIPQYIFAAKMKKENFYNEIRQNLKPNLITHPKYNQLKTGNNKSLYFALKHNILYATNNVIQINNFVDNRIEKNNFLHSEYASDSKNAMFVNADLDLSSYPKETQEFLLNFIFFSNFNQVKFIDQFSKFKLKIPDEYTKIATIELKKNNQNSLETILKFADETFYTYLNGSY